MAFEDSLTGGCRAGYLSEQQAVSADEQPRYPLNPAYLFRGDFTRQQRATHH